MIPYLFPWLMMLPIAALVVAFAMHEFSTDSFLYSHGRHHRG